MAKSGHGATIAAEFDPVASQGAFTVLGELNANIKRVKMRDETEVTPHTNADGTICLDDVWVTSNVRKRDMVVFSINFVYGRASETALNTLYDAHTTFGIRIRGALATSTDYWIGSGELTKIEDDSPVRTGVRTANYSFRFSGPMIVV